MSKLPFPERVLHQHIAILGKTGAGKSSAMRVLAEHLLDKQRRICIVDPKGDWWGLKSSADGKSAGYPVITFGNFKEPRATDVPINEHSGAHVAELIAKGNRPCVIGFRGWMPGQLVKFWLALFRRSLRRLLPAHCLIACAAYFPDRKRHCCAFSTPNIRTRLPDQNWRAMPT